MRCGSAPGTWVPDRHANSLGLPPGSSAITAPICIDSTYPYFRLFAKAANLTKNTLKIDVLFYDSKGNVVAAAPYTAWHRTP